MQKHPLRRFANLFGFDVTRLNAPPDTYVYKKHFSEASILNRAFLNIGAGSFKHPCWTNLDYYANGSVPAGHVHIDLMSLKPLPFHDEFAEIAYCSHTIEHVSNAAVINLLKETFRVLKKGGIFRIVTPDIDLAYDAWRKNDRDFFFWIEASESTGNWKTTNMKMPLTKTTLAQVFLIEFASSASEVSIEGAAKRISDDELINVFENMKYEDALDYCISRCPEELQQKFSYQHMNWFNEKKLHQMLSQSGFKTVYRSGYLQSKSPVLRNVRYFDQTLPRTSLYLEAIK